MNEDSKQQTEPIRVAVVGLGPIGLRAAELVLERPALRLVAVADADPARAGRRLSELLAAEVPEPPDGDPADHPDSARVPQPVGESSAVRVDADGVEALARERPDAALICTSSSLAAVAPLLRAAAAAGANAVSPCEELLLPDLRHPELAAELDAEARRAGVTFLGTGVNPGFVLDYLPAVLAAASRRVEGVRGLRVVDAGSRRRPLQRKVGAGLRPEEFERRAADGALGHVGMRESVALLGRALGFELDEIGQRTEPVIAERDLETAVVTVRRGEVAGIRNVGFGDEKGRRRVRLELQMYVGAAEPRDELTLEGEPELRLAIAGGVPGDLATAAILVNWIPGVVRAAPGLSTVLDLPPPTRADPRRR